MTDKNTSSETPAAPAPETAKSEDMWDTMMRSLVGACLEATKGGPGIGGWAELVVRKMGNERKQSDRLGLLLEFLGRSLWIATSPGHSPEEERDLVAYSILLAREIHRVDDADVLNERAWDDAYSDAAEAAGVDPKLTRRDRALTAARRARITDPELRRRLYAEELARGEAILRAKEEGHTDGK